MHDNSQKCMLVTGGPCIKQEWYFSIQFLNMNSGQQFRRSGIKNSNKNISQTPSIVSSPISIVWCFTASHFMSFKDSPEWCVYSIRSINLGFSTSSNGWSHATTHSVKSYSNSSWSHGPCKLTSIVSKGEKEMLLLLHAPFVHWRLFQYIPIYLEVS